MFVNVEIPCEKSSRLASVSTENMNNFVKLVYYVYEIKLILYWFVVDVVTTGCDYLVVQHVCQVLVYNSYSSVDVVDNI